MIIRVKKSEYKADTTLNRMKKSMRTICANEVWKLANCVQELSEYHNEISGHFKGTFPSRPYDITLKIFENALNNNTSRILVEEKNNQIIGFCKIDINDGFGKLDYIVVLHEYRGQGYGTAFMDWAMSTFEEKGITEIEVKVIDGNKTIALYEKYGFKMHSHIMRKRSPVCNE